MCGSDVFLAVIALIFPPLAVWVKRGVCSGDSLINIALCCLGFIPGLIHAWYIIAQYPEATYERVPQNDAERGQVTYYYVQHGQPQYGRQGGQRQYGTVNSTPNAQFPAGQEQGFVQPQPAKPASQPAPATQQASGSSSTEIPPSYAQAVAGDNKIQHP